MEPVKRIMLLHKDSPQPVAAACNLKPWLESRGVCSETVCASAETMELRATAAACDAVLVLGGDGTLVGAARRLSDIRTPLVGMNYGRVGFLAELPAMEQGDYDKAAEYLNNIIALRDFFVARDLWPSFSTAMNLLGYEGNFAPDYVSPIQEKYIQEIKDELVRIGEL